MFKEFMIVVAVESSFEAMQNDLIVLANKHNAEMKTYVKFEKEVEPEIKKATPFTDEYIDILIDEWKGEINFSDMKVLMNAQIQFDTFEELIASNVNLSSNLKIAIEEFISEYAEEIDDPSIEEIKDPYVEEIEDPYIEEDEYKETEEQQSNGFVKGYTCDTEITDDMIEKASQLTNRTVDTISDYLQNLGIITLGDVLDRESIDGYPLDRVHEFINDTFDVT